MRRIAAGVAVWALLASLLGIAAGADSIIDEQYKASPPPVMGQPGWISGYYDDGIDDARTGSALYGVKDGDGQGRWKEVDLCKGLTDPACSKYSDFHFTSYLPECSDTVQTDCIVGLAAIVGDKELAASFVRQIPETGPTDFVGNASIGVPTGESPSLWRFDGLSHAGGDTFLISAQVAGWLSNNRVDSQLRTSLYPVSIKTGTGPNTVSAHVAQYVNGMRGFGARDERVYLLRGDNEVLERWPFPADTSFRITIRVAKPLVGWLHGRVLNPTINITSGAYGQQFTITAQPTSVPTVDKWNRFTSLPSELQAILNAEGRASGAYYYGSSGDANWENVSVSHQSGGDMDDRGMRKFLLFLQAADDRAAANKSSWTIRTIRGYGSLGSSCLQDSSRLVGVVSTNATVYLGGPPSFNTATQTLDYRVAAPHFGRTGDLNIGNYSLVMRSDVARCIYGFKDAPYSATVSVVSADGSPQVATTTVAQRDGWLYLTAGGFTYSNPTVQVKLTQEPSKPVTPPTETKPTVAKKTITCSKGKQTKKVTAVNPKCPSGWKRK